jgi:hypothetical protein
MITNQTSASQLQFPACLPSAGPSASPHLMEIDVGPWHRISVLFCPVLGETAECGKVWYWRPESMARLPA